VYSGVDAAGRRCFTFCRQIFLNRRKKFASNVILLTFYQIVTNFFHPNSESTNSKNSNFLSFNISFPPQNPNKPKRCEKLNTTATATFPPFKRPHPSLRTVQGIAPPQQRPSVASYPPFPWLPNLSNLHRDLRPEKTWKRLVR
jgi:hypothetical protein